MGYKRPPLRLVFEDPEMDGFECRVRRIKVGALVRIVELSDGDLREGDKELVELAEALTNRIIEWNLEDEETGEPYPVTAESLLDQDLRFIREVALGMIRVSTGVYRPLGQRSIDGSELVDLPMENLPN